MIAPLVIEAIDRVKERRAHLYASDQYGVDSAVEDDVLEGIVRAVLTPELRHEIVVGRLAISWDEAFDRDAGDDTVARTWENFQDYLDKHWPRGKS